MVRGSGLDSYKIALLVTIFVAAIYSFVSDKNCKGLICRGDFPAFYSAAELKLQNANLYDPNLQKEVQNRCWPSLSGKYLYFSYPPYLADILSPLALLNHRHAKFLFLLISICLISQAIYLIKKEEAANDYLSIIFALIIFFPSIVGIVSGQNFSLSFLILTTVYISLKNAREFPAGLAIGLWAFKPHFALIAFSGLIFCRLWKAALCAASIFALAYLVAAYNHGVLWPLNWISAVSFFYKEDLIKNGHQMVSLVSSFELINMQEIGMILSISLLGIFYYICIKNGVNSYIQLLPAVIVLCSPHTMYYDISLTFIPLLFRPLKLSFFLICMFFSALFLFRELFLFSPLIALPFITLIADSKR